jgi:hypothetical protein
MLLHPSPFIVSDVSKILFQNVSELLALATRARNAAKDSIAEHEKVSSVPCYDTFFILLTKMKINDDIKYITKKF